MYSERDHSAYSDEKELLVFSCHKFSFTALNPLGKNTCARAHYIQIVANDNHLPLFFHLTQCFQCFRSQPTARKTGCNLVQTYREINALHKIFTLLFMMYLKGFVLFCFNASFVLPNQNSRVWPGSVTTTCNSNYLGGRNQENCSSKDSLSRKLMRLHLNR